MSEAGATVAGAGDVAVVCAAGSSGAESGGHAAGTCRRAGSGADDVSRWPAEWGRPAWWRRWGGRLAARGERVLLTDTCSFGVLPFYFGAREIKPGVVRTFSGGTSDPPIRVLTLEAERYECDPDLLRREMARGAQDASRVLIDVATGSAAMLRQALRLAPMVLVPVVPDMASVVTLQSLEGFFRNQEGLSGKPLQAWYVLNQFDPSSPLQLDVREVLRQQLGERLLPFAVHRSPAVSEALAEGMTVLDYAPNSPAAEDVMSLVTWIRNTSAAMSARASRGALERAMTQAELWEGFETGRGPFFRLLRIVLIAAGMVVLFFFGSLPLSWPQQAVLGLLILLLCVWLSRVSDSYLITLTLMMLSMFATFRYGWWRVSAIVAFFQDPGTKWGPVDVFFILLLLGAEAYAFGILYLGFLQTVWPLRRAPVALPDDPEDWPEVDLLIPTYNEPLNVVRYTALASLNIDWPAEKLHVYILDDGNREEFREFAVEAGIGYMTRGDNIQAKAGNINHALKSLSAPYVAIFDSDHVPTRSFLQMTIGWFLKDPNLGMLQTPHHFYSPDPFERNLGQFRVIPNEGELFYGIVQDGNDFWNAAFFCGSCAVLRREALDEIGGIAAETVTEDAHTCLRMQIARMEYGVHQHSAGGGPGDGAAERAREAADPVGAGDDSDSADRESVCLRRI